MANPKLHRKGAPAGWINSREIAGTTGFRIQAVLQMLFSSKVVKREPTIWSRVTGHEWKDMPGGGQSKVAVWEEYEAFPGLEWPTAYRPETVEDEMFFRYGGSDKTCLPEAQGLDIIRRCRAYRIACNLYVPRLREGLLATDEPEPEREITRVDDVDTTVVEIGFQRGYASGWFFAYQPPNGRRYPFLNRRNGKVLVVTPGRKLRAWGDGPGNEGVEWRLMVNGENVVLRWHISRWETPDPLDAATVEKIVTHRR